MEDTDKTLKAHINWMPERGRFVFNARYGLFIELSENPSIWINAHSHPVCAQSWALDVKMISVASVGFLRDAWIKYTGLANQIIDHFASVH